MANNTNRQKTILIASSTPDKIVWEPVADILRQRKYRVVVYEADRVADMSVPLSLTVRNGKPSAILRYGGDVLDISSIRAAWYRRPTTFNRQEVKDRAMQMSLDFERRAIQYSLWNLLPEQVWLNDPLRIVYAERKLTQMLVANQLGFSIPDTHITNNWQYLDTLDYQKIVFKSSYGRLYAGNEQRMHFTQVYDKEGLPRQCNPFPGFWQPYKHKNREWRITVVGSKSFDAIITTDESAKDDWRYHQFSSKVRFERGEFPEVFKKKCYQYLERFGLRYGAFDFIEDSEGSIFFFGM